MEKGINPALHARVVIEGIAVKVAELKDILLHGGVSKRCDDIDFDKDSSLESYKALKMLDKKHYISIVNVFTYR